MNEWIEQFLAGRVATGAADLETLVLCLLLAFVLGQLLAWVYSWTHSGLSYSRSFVQSIILLTIIAALVMALIGHNIVAAFGLIGAMAIIRFRNVLKDTRDTVFIFGSLVVGMGAGSRQFGLAIVGTLALCAVSLYLHFTQFGTREHHDGMLRFRFAGPPVEDGPVGGILHRHCRSLSLISVRKAGVESEPDEFSYYVTLRNRRRNAELIEELARVEGLGDVSLALTEELQEI